MFDTFQFRFYSIVINGGAHKKDKLLCSLGMPDDILNVMKLISINWDQYELSLCLIYLNGLLIRSE